MWNNTKVYGAELAKLDKRTKTLWAKIINITNMEFL